VYLTPPMKGFPVEFGIGVRGPKCLNDGPTRWSKKFSDRFIRFDTIPAVTDSQPPSHPAIAITLNAKASSLKQYRALRATHVEDNYYFVTVLLRIPESCGKKWKLCARRLLIVHKLCVLFSCSYLPIGFSLFENSQFFNYRFLAAHSKQFLCFNFNYRLLHGSFTMRGSLPYSTPLIKTKVSKPLIFHFVRNVKK